MSRHPTLALTCLMAGQANPAARDQRGDDHLAADDLRVSVGQGVNGGRKANRGREAV
jgi:hypothetical protein